MENVIEKEEVSTKRLEAEGLTNRVAMSLNQSIVDISNSTPNMPGKVVYALTKSQAKIKTAIGLVEDARKKVLKQYCEVNKDGSFKVTTPSEEEIANGVRPEYVYKKKDGIEKAKTAFDELLDLDADVELYKIPLHMFENMTINTQRVNFLDLFIEHMIIEPVEMGAL